MTERLVTAREVADHLGVQPSWVLRRFNQGRIPGYRLAGEIRPVRFRLSDVLRALEVDAPPARRDGDAPQLRSVQ